MVNHQANQSWIGNIQDTKCNNYAQNLYFDFYCHETAIFLLLIDIIYQIRYNDGLSCSTMQPNHRRAFPLQSNIAQPSYFIQAIDAMAALGFISDAQKNGSNAMLPLVDRIGFLNEEKALFIARVMHYNGTFNEIVRTRIQAVYSEDRTSSVMNSFDALSKDIESMISWLEDGKLNWKEKLKTSLMELRSGPMSDRFTAIKETFKNDIRTSNEQIIVENAVVNAYQLYCLAINDAKTAAVDILNQSSQFIQTCKSDLILANEKIDKATTPAEKLSNELLRDELADQLKGLESTNLLVIDLKDALTTTETLLEATSLVLQSVVGKKRQIHESNIKLIKSTEELISNVVSYSESVRTGNGNERNIASWADLINKAKQDMVKFKNESGGLVQELKSHTTQSENCMGVTMAITNFTELLDKAK